MAIWNKKKSQDKATKAATGAGVGAIGGGGIVYALLTLLCKFTDLELSEQDKATIAGFVGVVSGPIFAWVKTYFQDKKKHNG